MKQCVAGNAAIEDAFGTARTMERTKEDTSQQWLVSPLVSQAFSVAKSLYLDVTFFPVISSARGCAP